MRIVFIPGLGYDCRIFEKLVLPDVDIEYLNWIEPLKNEPIQNYAKRLFLEVKPYSRETILIGHSFGGVISQEIACQTNIKKVIIISSIKSRDELPLNFKLLNSLKLHGLFTKEISIKTVDFWGSNHGLIGKEEKKLFKSMLGRYSNSYLQWALKSLCSWKGIQSSLKADLIHIHGTKDKTLPFNLIKKPDFIIKDGSHVCLLNKSDEISKIIQEIISNTPSA